MTDHLAPIRPLRSPPTSDLARRIRTGLVALVVVSLLLAAYAQDREAGDRPTYLDPARSVAERVDDLLGRMTLEEKVGQMAQINLGRLTGSGEWDGGELNETFVERYLVDLGVGSVLSGGGFAPVPNTPAGWAEATNALQRAAVEGTRLGIPIVYGVDAVHGHNNVQGAVLFPHNIGLAATRDSELVRRVARRTAGAVRATGVHWNFAPVADVGVDPRWGRFYETFGDDPALVAELVVAAIEGYQGGGLDDPGSVAATVKHFVGYGAGAEGRDRAPATLTSRELREVHLPPAAAGIAAGAATAMANSGAVNGVPVHASHALLTELLRDELGFGGVLVSDWEDLAKLETVHRYVEDDDAAVAAGIGAGIDVSMIPNDAERFTATLLELVARGEVSEARIDAAVRRVLTLKFDLGLFEDPYVDPVAAAARLADPGDAALAREAAAASLTLLTNDGALPFGPEVETLLVTGPRADDLAAQLGGWTIGWQGLPVGSPRPPGSTVLEALQARYGEDAVRFRPSRRAAAAEAGEVDLAVVVLGESPYAEGEGDVADLALPAAQLALLRAVAETGTPTVGVLISGRPRTLPDALLGELDAFVMAYLPGSGGGTAVADLLTGDAVPTGRLPFRWPRFGDPLPLESDAATRFPFGFGLTWESEAAPR